LHGPLPSPAGCASDHFQLADSNPLNVVLCGSTKLGIISIARE
jgi:hypothetical protein